MFLEYGISEYGELVHIDIAPRGLTHLTCPYCGGQLLAKKGSEKIHHFAHAGETCREVASRDESIFRLPFYDKFDLGLSPKEVKYLHDFHNESDSHIDPLKERTIRQSLETQGFIDHNPFAGRGGAWELTHLGKIPVGAATLQKFAELQLERLIARHQELQNPVSSAFSQIMHNRSLIQDYEARIKNGANPEPYLNHYIKNNQEAMQRAEAKIIASLADLNIYRAQLRRVFSTALYFLEIKHAGGLLYKVGISNRNLEARIEEIKRDLSAHLSNVQITILHQLAHRGSIEFYFKHRYRQHQHRLGSLTEYFSLEDRKNILSDLSRLGDYEPDAFMQAIIEAQVSEIEKRIEEEGRATEREAKRQAASLARSQATKAGMQRAIELGIHVGRPSEENSKLIAKYPEVVELLRAGGYSLRDINDETGVAVNTIRKVKAALDTH